MGDANACICNVVLYISALLDIPQPVSSTGVCLLPLGQPWLNLQLELILAPPWARERGTATTTERYLQKRRCVSV
jgi:hypothetical protein